MCNRGVIPLLLPAAFAGVSAALASHDALDADVVPVPEAMHAARYVPRRARHFHSGRALARRLLAARGFAGAVLAARADGTVAWPAGLCGSLAHCDERAAVALAACAHWRSLGIDVEPMMPLPADAARLVLTARDRAGLAAAADAALLARAVFCVKECVHKAVFPLTGVTLEFDDVGVDISPGGAVQVHAQTARGAQVLRACPLTGVLLRQEDHWVALLGVPAGTPAPVTQSAPPTA